MRRQLLLGLVAAVAIGLLEAAWTGPGRGAPTNTWLGVLAILILMGVVTFPHVWLIPALAILEEIVHGFVGYPGWVPTWATLSAHWSHAYVGFPLMPYLTFPLLTVAGFLAWIYLRPRATRLVLGRALSSVGFEVETYTLTAEEAMDLTVAKGEPFDHRPEDDK